MRTFIVGLWLASTLAAGVAVAQQAPFNEAGVTMGHWHLVSHDVAANKNIFVAMGGTPVTRGTAEGVRFPGARVNLNLGEEPPGKGGSVGSVINHVGFIVNNVQEQTAKWKSRRRAGAGGQQQQARPGLRRDAGRRSHRNPRRQEPDDSDPA